MTISNDSSAQQRHPFPRKTGPRTLGRRGAGHVVDSGGRERLVLVVQQAAHDVAHDFARARARAH